MKKLMPMLLILYAGLSRAQTWSPVGGGLSGQVLTINKWNNNIFAAGDIIAFNNTALWDGIVWTGMSAGTIGNNICSETYNGNLILAGGFSINGQPSIATNNIAAWNGSYWDSIGCGTYVLDFIRKLCVFNNELYGGGYQMSVCVGGSWVGRELFRLNGNSWDTVPLLSPLGVNDLDVFQNKLYITTPDNSPQCNSAYLYSYDGITSTLICDSLFDFMPYQSAVHQNNFFVTGVKHDWLTNQHFLRLIKYDGSMWHDVGSWITYPTTTIYDMLSFNGDLFIAGDFYTVNNTSYGNLAKFSSGNLFPAIGVSVNGNSSQSYIHCLFGDTAENKLYIGGSFNLAGSTPATNIAVWDIGSSIEQLSDEFNALISPNPSNTSFNISILNFTKPTITSLSDLTGRTVSQFQITSAKQSVNVSNLKSGLYFLMVDDVVKKVIVE